jgi:PTS system N-acetylglucosamine-specific IIC component
VVAAARSGGHLLFSSVIGTWNLETPGREDDDAAGAESVEAATKA